MANQTLNLITVPELISAESIFSTDTVLIYNESLQRTTIDELSKLILDGSVDVIEITDEEVSEIISIFG